MNIDNQCPCGTGRTYSHCCGIFISQQKMPATPEELMRSRYTAYNKMNIDYILHTMKSPAADGFDINAARKSSKKIKWIKLEIIESTYDSVKGKVEFIAYYYFGNKKYSLHEISEFNFLEGRWYYVDGIQITS